MALAIQGLTTLIQVFDMQTSIDFYTRVLGFEVANTSGPENDIGWAMLHHTSGIELMLNTAYETPERPAAPDPARVKSHADTILYLSCADVDAGYAHLRAHGLDVPEPSIAPYGMKQLYFQDPDGYLLCLQRWP